MKLEIYAKEEKSYDGFARLMLKATSSGCIDVIAASPEGTMVEQGFLVRFTTDGTIWHHPSVNRGLGFQLNRKGEIKVSGVNEDD